MKLEGIAKLIIVIGGAIGVLYGGGKWAQNNIFPGIQDTHLLRHINQSNADVQMALMDKVKGDWYTVDETGAVTDVLMFETAEHETFVYVPNERVFWMHYKVHYDDIRKQWYYQDFDEHGVRTIIYKR